MNAAFEQLQAPTDVATERPLEFLSNECDQILGHIASFRETANETFGAIVVRNVDEMFALDLAIALETKEEQTFELINSSFKSEFKAAHKDTGQRNDATVHFQKMGSICMVVLIGGDHPIVKQDETGSAEIEIANAAFNGLSVMKTAPIKILRATLEKNDLIVFDHTLIHAVCAGNAGIRESEAFYHVNT